MNSAAIPEPAVVVMDTNAMLAFLEGEPAGAQVKGAFQQARSGQILLYLPLINLGEILYITERERGLTRARAVLGAIQQLPVIIHAIDQELVFFAAHIKAGYPLSYADAFVVAAAQRLTGRILTGDPEFQAVKDLVVVEWLKN